MIGGACSAGERSYCLWLSGGGCGDLRVSSAADIDGPSIKSSAFRNAHLFLLGPETEHHDYEEGP